ncbi:MAG: hypothetical protein ACI8ZM_003737 [Crocinitomix sp.]|jgi:hypothetical protein
MEVNTDWICIAFNSSDIASELFYQDNYLSNSAYCYVLWIWRFGFFVKSKFTDRSNSVRAFLHFTHACFSIYFCLIRVLLVQSIAQIKQVSAGFLFRLNICINYDIK